MMYSFPISSLIYFYLNNNCYRHPSKNYVGYPPIPKYLSIARGTTMSIHETWYFLSKGIFFGGLGGIDTYVEPLPTKPSLLDLRINVNAYPKKPNFKEPRKHPPSRNCNFCHPWYSIFDCNYKKLELIENFNTLYYAEKWSLRRELIGPSFPCI